MLIEYMKEAYPNFQDRRGNFYDPKSSFCEEQLPEVHDLQEFYKAYVLFRP